jgi:hypothetical protein
MLGMKFKNLVELLKKFFDCSYKKIHMLYEDDVIKFELTPWTKTIQDDDVFKIFFKRNTKKPPAIGGMEGFDTFDEFVEWVVEKILIYEPEYIEDLPNRYKKDEFTEDDLEFDE